MPEAEGERGSLGVEEMRLVRDGNEKSAFGGGWSFTGLEVGKGILDTVGGVEGVEALVTRTGGGVRGAVEIGGLGAMRGGEESNASSWWSFSLSSGANSKRRFLSGR
jgi:hypothetical protein